MKQCILNLLFGFAILIQGLSIHHLRNSIESIKSFVPEEKETIEETLLFLNKSPKEGLIEALEYYKVKHPNIVYAQAILETGHFKSKICRDYNNLFGLYDNKKKDYYRFNHWSESVIAYMDKIQYRYRDSKPPDAYYEFLSNIGYASDPEYINKLKSIVNKNDKRRSK